MNMMSLFITAATLSMLPSLSYSADKHAGHQAVDHSTMDHSKMDHSKHQEMLKSAGQESKGSAERGLTIPNVVLLNEYGKEVAVMEDLVKDKMVVINTIYTTCTTVCPVMGVQFAQLQKVLKQRFGSEKIAKQIQLVSISIDPLNDTPQTLRSWKSNFSGGPGWTLLTGSQKNIERILKATGLFAADPKEHTPITLVGSAKLGQWTRLSGLGPAKQIAGLLDDLMTNNQTLAAADKTTKEQ